MSNPARTDFTIHPLLETRYSPRAFLDKQIPSDVLRRMFEAARWSPSCSNDQEWFFITGIRNQGQDFERICSVLTPSNQLWACKAALLMIICARTAFSSSGTQNRHHAYDCGQSAAHLSFQAAAEGVSIHQMAGFDAQKAISQFSVPNGIVPLTAVAMGYAGEAALLPDNLAKRETAQRVRRPQRDFVFGGEWGKPLFDA